jgi:hypothetical protein
VPADTATHAKPDEPKLTKNQQTIFPLLDGAGPSGLTTEQWNEQARAVDIGKKRKADLYDIRAALKSKGLVRQYGDRWNVSSVLPRGMRQKLLSRHRFIVAVNADHLAVGNFYTAAGKFGPTDWMFRRASNICAGSSGRRRPLGFAGLPTFTPIRDKMLFKELCPFVWRDRTADGVCEVP